MVGNSKFRSFEMIFCFATKKIKNGFWPFVFPTWNSDARYIQTHNSFRIIFIGQVCKTHTEFVSEICLPLKFSVVWIFRRFSFFFSLLSSCPKLSFHCVFFSPCRLSSPCFLACQMRAERPPCLIGAVRRRGRKETSCDWTRFRSSVQVRTLEWHVGIFKI